MLLCLFSGELMTEILKTAMKVFLPIVVLMQSNILACFIGAPDPVTVDAARGYQALITRSFVPGQFPRVHIDEAWKTWGLPANQQTMQPLSGKDTDFRKRPTQTMACLWA